MLVDGQGFRARTAGWPPRAHRPPLPGQLSAAVVSISCSSPTDDLLPQPTWPGDHQPRVDTFVSDIAAQPGLRVTLLNWSSGLVLASRT